MSLTRVLKIEVFIALLIFIFGFQKSNFAQTSTKGIEEQKKKAALLFEEKKYIEAAPLYSQILSLYPKDPEINFRYGACLVYAEKDKDKCLPYLNFALKQNEYDPEAHYFLGMAYHYGFRFSDAITQFELFKQKAPGKSIKKFDPDLAIRWAKNGKELVSNVIDIKVLEKKELVEGDFFRSYALGDFGGRLIVKPDEFKSDAEKKLKENTIIFLPEKADVVYFSGYGKSGNSNKDIFRAKKKANGEWGEPVSIGAPVNTDADEDFPFMHPNGKVLYFCSKGHNSMGGYDIFKSEYDAANDTWSKPVNLDFAISSPNDDILFITDAEMNKAYFASKRSSIGNKITIYKIEVETRKSNKVLIAGKFIPLEKDKTNIKATITIREADNNKLVGKFNPNEVSGAYLLNVPSGSSLKFIVDYTDLPPQVGLVQIPNFDKLRTLKQEMQLVTQDNATKLIIKNLFDEAVDEDLFAREFYKQRELLEPSAVEAEPNLTAVVPDDKKFEAIDAEKKKREEDNQKEIDNLVRRQADSSAIIAQKREEESIKAWRLANKKTNEGRKILGEIQDLEARLAASKVAAEKEQLLKQAQELKRKRENIAIEAAIAYDMASSIESGKTDVSMPNVLRNSLGNPAEIGAQLTSKRNRKGKLIAEKSSLQSEIMEIDNEIQKKQDQLKQTKNKTEIENLNKDIEDAKADLKELLDKNDVLADDIVQTDFEVKQLERKQKMLDENVNFEAEIAQENINDKIDKNQLRLNVDELGVLESAEIESINVPLSLKTEVIRQPRKKISELENKAIEPPKDVAQNTQSVTNNSAQISTNSTNSSASNLNELNSKNNNSQNSTSPVSASQNTASNIPNNTNAAIQQSANKNDEQAISRNEESAVNNSISTQTNTGNVTIKSDEQGNPVDITNGQTAEVIRAKNPDVFNKDFRVKDANGNTKDYAKMFEKAISSANTIADRPEKLNELQVIHQNYLQAINQDLLNNEAVINLLGKAPNKSPQQLNDLSNAEFQTEALTNKKRQIESQLNFIENQLKEQKQLALQNQNNTTSTTSNPIAQNELGTSAQSANQNTAITQTENSINNQTQTNNINTQSSSSSNQTISTSATNNAVNTSQEISLADTQTESLDEFLTNTTQLFAEQIGNENYINNQKRLANERKVEVTQLKLESEQLIRQAAQERDNVQKQRLIESSLEKDRQVQIKQVQSQLAFNRAERASFMAINEKLKLLPDAQNLNLLNEEKTELELLKKNIALEETNINNNISEIEKALSNNEKLSWIEKSNKSAENIQEYQLAIKNLYKEAGYNVDAVELNRNEIKLPLLAQQKQKFKNQNLSPENQSDLPLNIADLTPELYKSNTNLVKVNRGAENAEYFNISLLAIEEQESVRENKQAIIALEEKQKELFNEKENLQTRTSFLENQIKFGNKKQKKEAQKSLTTLQAEQQLNNTNIEENARKIETINTQQSQLIARLNLKPLQISGNLAQNTVIQNQQDTITNTGTNSRNVAVVENSIASNQTVENNAKIDTSILNNSTRKTEENTLILSQNPQLTNTPENNNLAQSSANSDTTLSNSSINKIDNTAPIKQTDLNVKEGDVSLNNVKVSITENASDIKNNKDVNAKNNANQVITNPINIQAGDVAMNNVKVSITDAESASAPANTNSFKQPTNQLPKSAITIPTSFTKPIDVSQFSPPIKIDQPIFSITEQATYSNAKPIPVEEKLPEGLIFKVQIGAFRNPIPQDLYKGFAPISGIKANNGLTRYYAGYFNEFTDADFAKERVRERGYKDAFVVAFFNGERIPIFQAINILASQGGRIPESLAAQAGVAGTTVANTAQTLIPQPGAANFQLLPNQNQLYYTVQVGAFSQQVSPSKLFNLQPLYVATANNGMLRYHVGIFDNVNTASAEKNKIVQIGITDAFVTAYLNGQRVTIEQASQEQQKGTPLIKLPEINQPIRQEQTTTQNNSTNMLSNSNATTNAPPPAPGETEFSVQIGAYNFEVPNDIAAIYLSLSDKQVSFFKDENNLTIYRAGRFKNYKDAENLKNEIAKIDLLKGAFVIAVNKNKKINLEDAINAAGNP